MSRAVGSANRSRTRRQPPPVIFTGPRKTYQPLHRRSRGWRLCDAARPGLFSLVRPIISNRSYCYSPPSPNSYNNLRFAQIPRSANGAARTSAPFGGKVIATPPRRGGVIEVTCLAPGRNPGAGGGSVWKKPLDLIISQLRNETYQFRPHFCDPIRTPVATGYPSIKNPWRECAGPDPVTPSSHCTGDPGRVYPRGGGGHWSQSGFWGQANSAQRQCRCIDCRRGQVPCVLWHKRAEASMTPRVRKNGVRGGSQWPSIGAARNLRKAQIAGHCLRPKRRSTGDQEVYEEGTRAVSSSEHDKIVLEAVRMILEAMYEPIFLDCSHGFRPGRSCHSALRTLRVAVRAPFWALTADLAKCFFGAGVTGANHRLIGLIEQRCGDRRFIRLLWKILRAGYLEFRQYKTSWLGVPRGKSDIFQILCNIYLNPLDRWITDKITTFNCGARETRINPVWRNLSGKINAPGCPRNSAALSDARQLEGLPNALGGPRWGIMRAQATLLNWQKGPVGLLVKRFAAPNAGSEGARGTQLRQINRAKILYIRYADDLIIAFSRTSRLEAVRWQHSLDEYLSQTLYTRNTVPPKITNLNRGKALFLGTYVSCKSSSRWPNFKNVSNTPFASCLSYGRQYNLTRVPLRPTQGGIDLLPIAVLLDRARGDILGNNPPAQAIRPPAGEQWPCPLRGNCALRAPGQKPLVYTDVPSRIRGRWIAPDADAAGPAACRQAPGTLPQSDRGESQHSEVGKMAPSNRVYLQAPLDKIKRKLFQRGIISLGGNQSRALNALKKNSHDQIIQYYNSITTNLLKYYSFVDNWNSLKQQLKLWIRGSCVRTLSAKYRCTAAQIYKKFGQVLASKISVRIKSSTSELSNLSKDQRSVLRIRLSDCYQARLDRMATPEREIWSKYFIPTVEGNHLTFRGPFLNFAHNSPQHPEWQKYLIKYSLIAGDRNPMNFQTCNDFFVYPTLALGKAIRQLPRSQAT
ncbi:putative groupII intron reverse transcriptase /maturase (mitochondrion) [Bryopsis sp. KO-2023]|nr:putative groupII intron reverse transcriptase /maturase [Bryopsis sp. KO-2023]